MNVEGTEVAVEQKPKQKPARKPKQKPARKPKQKPARKPKQKPARKPAAGGLRLELTETLDSIDTAAFLRQVRQAVGFTQLRLAERMGTQPPSVARIEAGTFNLQWSTLVKYLVASGRRVSIVVDP